MPSNASDKQEQSNVLVGMGAGGTAAAVAGGVIGAVTGGPIGAIAGASLGGMIGSVSGGALAYGDVEPEFRREYETSSTTARGTHRWESISPAYRYGWESHDRRELQGKSWDQIHTDLEKTWTGEGRWADYEPHVRSAWERRATRQAPAPAPANFQDQGRDLAATPSDHEEVTQGAGPLGALALGGTSGAYLGGVMGLLVGGPIGLAVGGTLGTVIGAAIAGGVEGDWHEPAFQAHHESLPHPTKPSWDQARVAYRYGWESHDRLETGGKSWAEALPELEKGWNGPGRFADFESYIKHGWEKRIPSPVESEAPETT